MKLNLIVENLTGRVIPLPWTKDVYRLPAGESITLPLEKTDLFCGGSKMTAGRSTMQDMVDTHRISVSVETDLPIVSSDESVVNPAPAAPTVRTSSKTPPDLQVSLEDAERLRRLRGVNPHPAIQMSKEGKGRLNPTPGTDMEDAGQRTVDISKSRSIGEAMRKAEQASDIQTAVQTALDSAPAPKNYRVRQTVNGG